MNNVCVAIGLISIAVAIHAHVDRHIVGECNLYSKNKSLIILACKYTTRLTKLFGEHPVSVLITL